MKKSIEKQITGIREAVKKLGVLVDEKLDKEFNEIMQNWASATSTDMLNGDLKKLKIYIDDNNRNYFIKSGDTILYYNIWQSDGSGCYDCSEFVINFEDLNIEIKLNILHNIGVVLNEYFMKLQDYIEKINADLLFDAE